MKRSHRVVLSVPLTLALGAIAAGSLSPLWTDPGALAYHPRIALAIGMVFWGTGLAVFIMAHPFGAACRLTLLHAVAGLASVAAPAANAELALARQVEYVALAMLPFALVSFMTVVGVSGIKAAGHRMTVQWETILVGTTGLLLMVAKALQIGMGLPDDPLRQPLFANLALGLILGVLRAWRNFRTVPEASGRDRLWVVAVGAMGSIAPFAIFSVLPQAVVGRPLLPPELTVIATVLLPLSSIYGVLGREQSDVDFLIGRGMVYGTAAVTLLVAYFTVAAALQVAAPTLISSEYAPWLVVGFATVSAALYGPFKAYLERVADRLVYGDDYDLSEEEAWFSRELSQIRSVTALVEMVSRRLQDQLNLSFVRIELSTSGGSADSDRRGPMEEPTGMKLAAGAGEVTPAPIPVMEPHDLKPSILPRLQNGVRLELSTAERNIGFLTLGRKRWAGGLSRKDLQLLRTVAPQLTTALENTLLVEQLQRALAELERLEAHLRTAEDEQRQALAWDLHDSVLQQLLYVKRLVGIWEAHPQLAHELGERPTSAVQSVIDEVRALCSNLQPVGLELGDLSLALGNLAEATWGQHGLPIYLVDTAGQSAAALAPRNRLSLLRAAQEMVSNVVRHAQASEAYLYLEAADGEVILSMWDNGKGFSVPERLMDLVPQGHLGLAGLERRAQRLGGRLHIESEPSKGTLVALHVPQGGDGT